MLSPKKNSNFYLGPGKSPPDLNGGLLKGCMYAFGIQSSPTRLILISHALSANLARGVPCTLITPLPVEEFISYFDGMQADQFMHAIDNGMLRIFSPIGDYAKNIFRFGSERFVQELEYFSVPVDSFIVFDQAESLFTAEDKTIACSQAQVYRQWLRKTNNTAVFLFLQTGEQDQGSNYFSAFADYFSGIAHLHLLRNGLEIGIDYWSLQSGVMIAQPLPVTVEENGHIDIRISLASNRRAKRRPQKESELEKMNALLQRGKGSVPVQVTPNDKTSMPEHGERQYRPKGPYNIRYH